MNVRCSDIEKLMNKPPQPVNASPPWLLLAGLLAAAGFVVYMGWSSFGGSSSSSPHVIELTEANWQKEVVESKVPVVVDFWADWCGPCIQLSPTIERFAKKYEGKVKVGKLHVDQAGAIAKKYGVETIPVVMIFNGGEKPFMTLENRQGNTIADALPGAIEKALAAN